MCHARKYDPGPGHITHNGGVEGRFLYVEGSFFYVYFFGVFSWQGTPDLQMFCFY